MAILQIFQRLMKQLKSLRGDSCFESHWVVSAPGKQQGKGNEPFPATFQHYVQVLEYASLGDPDHPTTTLHLYYYSVQSLSVHAVGPN